MGFLADRDLLVIAKCGYSDVESEQREAGLDSLD